MKIETMGTLEAPGASTSMAKVEGTRQKKLYGWLIAAEEANTFYLTYVRNGNEITIPIKLNAGGIAMILSENLPIADDIDGDIEITNANSGSGSTLYIAMIYWE